MSMTHKGLQILIIVMCFCEKNQGFLVLVFYDLRNSGKKRREVHALNIVDNVNEATIRHLLAPGLLPE